MNEYLFLFTIGPVQSFISQARKARDLFGGSTLLSDLISFAINGDKIEVIFPDKDMKSLPNRFLAKITVDDPQLFGEALEKKVRNKFVSIINQKTHIKNPSNFYDFLDIHWVSIPYNDYIKNFSEIESLLGSVKNVRTFNQVMEDTSFRKCSVCGERIGKFYNNSKVIKNLTPDAVRIENDFTFSEGEVLCEVCFTKRKYSESSFPSVAEIALYNVIQELKDDEKYIKFKNVFGPRYDPELLYEENLNDRYFKNNGIGNLIPNLDNIKFQNEEIFKERKLKLSKYYGIITFDGDSMGKQLSGENLKDNQKLMEFHKSLSKSLGRFAEKTKEIIDDKYGKIVYAGGEDFLGFVNINYIFDALKDLRKAFDEIVNNQLKNDFELDKFITFSAGISIAHYKDPLYDSLNWAREMEHYAKENPGKDSIAIAVIKGSGEILKTRFKWKNDKNKWMIDYLNNILFELSSSNFSNNFIKTIQMEFKNLDNENNEQLMIESEIERLVKRSCMMEKLNHETDEEFNIRKKKEIDKLVQSIYELYNCSQTKNKEELFDILNVLDFVRRQIEND
ncbi:type III-B CRISPR-associated protein Cas10/Cmr2 [Athalassotoga saccharophila]|uniref:type III-B CRISPR-associated protein Cas10/Cmr2 n=1 Tax=Athalassotoga saccharophila TaxID=1441386 RepID=UPI00137A4A5F|nr:type III-B CRISPR-associated protein Cas10/Cmr2 [Athalassotoga saccharophila]BBJ28679.1 CRISPR-associated RAMP Cmr2 [Athalassotoga saccharophila]